MKLYLVLLGFFVAVRAEKSAAPSTPERRGTEKQEADLSSASPSALYRNSAKGGPAPAANVLTYNPQGIYSGQPVNYVSQAGAKYTPSPIPAHIMFGFSPQPQQFEYEAQTAYAQPATKSASSSARVAAPVPAFNFSPASEVSSFRFSSPLVTYSNQGVLSQATGKLAATQAEEPQPTPASKNAAPQPIAYSAVPQFAYNGAVQQKQEYAHAPQEYAYVQAPQVAFAAAAPQRVVYAAQPAAKDNYASAPRQYYAVIPQFAYSPQQAGHSASGLQLAYTLAPQSHSNPQQVYAIPSPVKYTNVNAQEAYNQ